MCELKKLILRPPKAGKRKMLLEQQMIEQARYLSFKVFVIRDHCAEALASYI